ncbi:MAG: GntR family transcriptional regulator [Cloacibacillus sp.]
MASVSAEDIAYNAIITMIIQHHYPPGSSVVEAQIAEHLNMSRTPVRSALKRLVSDGLLESTLNKGCFVPNLSRKDLDNLFHFRYLIEPDCAKEAAKKYTPAYKKKISALLKEEERCLKSEGGQLHIVNEKIHSIIVDIADNDYYLHSVKQVTWRCQLYLFFFDNFYLNKILAGTKSPSEDFTSSRQHVLLFDAISQNDTKNAYIIMQEHVSSTYELLTTNKWR